MKVYQRNRRRFAPPYCTDGLCEEYEQGYWNALEDAFAPVWSLLLLQEWITERDLTNAYLDFLSKDAEARKDWPETGSFVKRALRQFRMNGMIKEKDK
jgi:hypothetical protein